MAWFRRKKPTPPQLQIGEGHRGVAVGSTKPGEQDLSQENIDKWQTLPADEVKGFVYGGDLLFVHSTNVVAAQYDHQNQKMMVQFKGGKVYLYSSVTEQEAYAFATAQSKGGWVWSYLRIRGTKNGHRKPYTRL